MRVWDNLAQLKAPANAFEAPFGADVRLFAEAVVRRGGVGVYVAADDRQAFAAAAFARFFRPDLQVAPLPGWDNLPYDRSSPSPGVAAQRCATLARIAQSTGAPLLVVAHAGALIQKAPPVAHMSRASFVARVGQTVPPDRLSGYLSVNGYVRATTVREPGEYAMRGGIIDVFPPGAIEPVRFDFFGDTLEGARYFDPETQRSTSSLPEVALSPVSEIGFADDTVATFRRRYMAAFGPPGGDPVYESVRERIRRHGMEHLLPLFFDSLATVFDYAGDSALIGLAEGAMAAARERHDLVCEYHEARRHAARDGTTARILDPSELYLSGDDLEATLAGRAVVRFHASPAPEGSDAIHCRAQPSRSFAPERANPGINLFDVVTPYLETNARAGRRVIIGAWSAGSASRMAGFLADHGAREPGFIANWPEAPAGAVSVAELPAEAGFTDDDLVLVSEQDILGQKLARPRKRRNSAAVISEAANLSPGDLIVHVDHGVGRYAGLLTVDVNDAPHDCLELIYAGGDKILLPVENVELITRYGSEGGESAIDRLGGAAWQGRKARARKKILEMAEDLIRVAAERQLKTAPKTEGADGVFREFCARFPYEETDDQLNAIEDVVADLVSGRPMDRLICGDVGFGKTEVALRAAFLVAMSGLQVAVIAPTTLLARQHYGTFAERFAGWPINVRQLSRFVSSKDAAQTRQEIASGACDVVIGTHALLTEQVKFTRLGMLVIDEEQRFGVKHKEKLKDMKADVHVLTLSATPIPRTLQLSLAGIRDLSIIATPPVDRLAVRTYVVEFDPVVIREALLRERYRGGQSYFVAPRISDLPFIERFLREQVPEVSFLTAHGQMSTTELEDAMTAFYEGKADVLLATTIVESGIDIPRANTLVIHRADMFGLAQLYQLRGRVGRAKLRAYAYMTTAEGEQLTEGAEKRLKVLQSLDSLGAGFMLASHDLDMRGGGNLLGEEQSGHIREVGVELYQQMLEDAVNGLRSGDVQPRNDWSPQIEIGASVLIPEAYVADLATRLSLYRRLADLSAQDEREAFAAELIDRFGPLPEETRQLLDVSEVKVLCKQAGVAKVSAGPKGALVTFREDAPIDPRQLVAFVHKRPDSLKMRPDMKLVATGAWPTAKARLGAVRNLLNEILKMLRQG